MSAIFDSGYAAFNDKFMGIWSKEDKTDDIELLALYLQSEFVSCWMRSNNPSRKIRKFILEKLPIPDFSLDHWSDVKKHLRRNNLYYPGNADNELIPLSNSTLHNSIDEVYKVARIELGITDELASIFSLINNGEQTEQIIEAVREFQLSREYREYSQNMTEFERDFLENSGDLEESEIL